MALNTSLQTAAKNVLTSLSDLTTSATLTSVGTSDYDTDTGEVSSSDTDLSVSVLLVDLGTRELSNILATRFAGDPNEVKLTLKKAMIAGSDVSFTVKVGDKLTVSSQDWDVISATLDPAGALWELIVRLT